MCAICQCIFRPARFIQIKDFPTIAGSFPPVSSEWSGFKSPSVKNGCSKRKLIPRNIQKSRGISVGLRFYMTTDEVYKTVFVIFKMDVFETVNLWGRGRDKKGVQLEIHYKYLKKTCYGD